MRTRMAENVANMVPQRQVERQQAQLKRMLQKAEKDRKEDSKRHKRALETAKEGEAKQRRLKNEQAEKKRKAEAEVEKGRKQIQRIESGAAWTKNARQFLPEHMSARIIGHEEDALKREEEIKAWVEKEVKARVHEIETKFKVQEAAASTSSAKFLDVLGRKNQRYNLIVIELGMELMSQRLSALQAEQALRSILGKVYADKKEGTDYRVPPARMFRNWRRMLHPICKWISLRALTQAKQWHILHDGSTKNHTSILHVTARVEYFNGRVQDMPLDFLVPLNGDADTQAKAMIEALHSDVHKGHHAMLGNCVSAHADNAGGAKAESAHAEVMKEIMEMVPKLEAQQEVWDKLGPEEKGLMRKFHKRHCTGHQLQLISDAPHKEEGGMLEYAMKIYAYASVIQRFYCRRMCGQLNPKSTHRYAPVLIEPERNSCAKHARYSMKAARLRGSASTAKYPGFRYLHHPTKDPAKKYDTTLTPSIGDVLYCTSKAFAEHGDHNEYYLNVQAEFKQW